MNYSISSYQGLTDSKAAERLRQYGLNQISKAQSFRLGRLFLSQFTSPLILILLAAALISLFLSFAPNQPTDIFDGVLILIIVVLSGLSGFIQDYKAEKTMESLRQLSEPTTKVIRNGGEKEIALSQVVPGDIIILEAGDIIAADLELLAASHLSCDESVLTGESRHIAKKVGDRLYKGSSVQVGRGVAKVIATGMKTKLGSIASRLENIEEGLTPFQKEIKHLGKTILWLVLLIVVVILIVSVFKFNIFDSFMLAVSLAVAAIPEGLPAVLTVVLAMGAHAMMRKKSLVRRLSAVESMGDVEVICTDKTGTLTRNEMSVVSLYQDGKSWPATGFDLDNLPGLRELILCGALCNDTRVKLEDGEEPVFQGDQTEVALSKLAEHIIPAGDVSSYQRVDEEPFTSERKMMSVVCRRQQDDSWYVFSKGAPEILLARCSYFLNKEGEVNDLDEGVKQQILKQYKDFGSKALRVLGFAKKSFSSKISAADKGYETDLIWLGLMAISDPPRSEVRQAIKEVRRAGIRVIMLTGDHANTAQAVAHSVGLDSKGVITGDDLEKMSKAELGRCLRAGYNIFVRISPFHKLRILQLLEKKYHNVAMTGDGVNDALALKQANVGIAMGLRGTETAKEASDIVLLDDNFASIRDAVAEGRRSLDNIKKFINYLSVSNLAEVGVLFIATVFLTLREPILLPIHILWVNLITDGMPAIALGLDPARAGIMNDPPRGGQPIIDKKLKILILAIGLKKTLILLITFLLILPLGLPTARTALFTGFILYEFVRIATIRQQDGIGWLANKWLLSSLLISLALQLFLLYTPLHSFFRVVPLGLYPWLVLLIGVAVGYFSAILITKLIDKKFAVISASVK